MAASLVPFRAVAPSRNPLPAGQPGSGWPNPRPLGGKPLNPESSTASPHAAAPLDDASPLDAVSAAIRDAARRTDLEDPLGLADPLVVTDPAAGGWISAASLVDGAALPILLDGPIGRWGASPHAAAALAWKAYTYWLAVPAVVGLVRVNRVPLLAADTVLARLSYDRPFVTIGMRRPAVAVLPDDPYAGAPDVTVVPDRDRLIAALRGSLVDRHLTPLAAATHARVRIGSRALAGALAASVGYALSLVSPLAANPATEFGKPILDAFGVADLVELSDNPDGSVEVRRKTCCLAFTVPSLSICSTCCIQP